LGLLQDRGVDFRVIEYLQTPPTTDQLEHILTLLGLEPRELMRSNEKEYRSLNLDDPSLSREALISAMTTHPILIQRPIVVAGNKAAIGRPPEAVLDVL
jgi:arsenate reductase